MPIGLIESAWGGTPIETWMGAAARESCGLNKLPDMVGGDWGRTGKYLDPPCPLQGAAVQNEESQCWHSMVAPLTRLTIKWVHRWEREFTDPV